MRILTTLCFSAICISLSAQLYDAQWVISSNPSIVDFRNNGIHNSAMQGFFNIFLTSADICDSSGNLLFVTNGVNIYDQYGIPLDSGTGLSPCQYTTDFASNGLGIPQGALFLPAPGAEYLYYLFHFSFDTLLRPGTLYYSLINNIYGYGVVEKKNFVFYESPFSIFRGGGMTACKHANGRDYWIVLGGHNNNRYYKFLLTPDTLLGPIIQTIGPAYNGPYDIAYSKFSQDGSKYVTGCFTGLITVMDFDRCTGEFSNPITIYNESSSDSIHPVSGSTAVEFSPNGRFVYVSDKINLNQYDLYSTNIQDSIELFMSDSAYDPQIHMLQLAPNGKLYVSCWVGGFYIWHGINSPDEKGDSCKYVDTALITLTANTFNFPNMINYRLGPLIGSGCDTITSVGNGQLVMSNEIRIQPNPADKYVYVEMGMQGEYEFLLLNEAGQLIDKRETRQVDVFDTEKLPSGIYLIKAMDKISANQIGIKKIVVAH